MLEDVIKKYNLVEQELDYHSYNGYAPREKWKHHVIQHPDVLREYINECGIIGSTIKEVMLRYGHIFHLGNIDYIEGYEELEKISNCNAPIICGIEIDTPVTLVTDKGVFEFEFGDASTVTFAVKGIEEKIEPRPLDTYRYFEFDIKKIFKEIIGRKIIGCEVENDTWEDADANFTWAFGHELSYGQDAYIKSFALKLDNGYSLSTNAFYDYCEIYLVDSDGKDVIIPPTKLKDMIVTK